MFHVCLSFVTQETKTRVWKHHVNVYWYMYIWRKKTEFKRTNSSLEVYWISDETHGGGRWHNIYSLLLPTFTQWEAERFCYFWFSRRVYLHPTGLILQYTSGGVEYKSIAREKLRWPNTKYDFKVHLIRIKTILFSWHGLHTVKRPEKILVCAMIG